MNVLLTWVISRKLSSGTYFFIQFGEENAYALIPPKSSAVRFLPAAAAVAAAAEVLPADPQRLYPQTF